MIYRSYLLKWSKAVERITNLHYLTLSNYYKILLLYWSRLRCTTWNSARYIFQYMSEIIPIWCMYLTNQIQWRTCLRKLCY